MRHYDFRPRIADIAGASSTLSTVDEITGNSFDFRSRVFSGTGSSFSNFGKPASNIQSDFEYFLAKRASIFLDDRGFYYSRGDIFRVIHNFQLLLIIR